MRRAPWLFLGVLTIGSVCAARASADDAPFYLTEGDRVVFYGDSITDQRLYTTFVETFVVTRFPKRNITFVHSGWGGDRVSGGGGGPIDTRLERDVFAYKPTVVTVMLGMNDGSYQPFRKDIFEDYAKGYQHLVESVKEHVPGVRMTLIRPSPFDDVTHEPKFEGGYNKVLVRYGDFVQELAKKKGVDVADLNGPVVEATKKAFASDPERAKDLNPDRVHPSPAGQLLMAAALLKDWHAPALVSKAEIKVGDGNVEAKGTATVITDVRLNDGKLEWTQFDDALPFPIELRDQATELAVRSSDVVDALDQETLKVSGLKEGDYTLKIDDKEVGAFSSEQLRSGINLATLDTPMREQAAQVHGFTHQHNQIHFVRWREVQVPLQNEDKSLVEKSMKALDDLEAAIIKKQREAAQPKPHKFELVKKAA